MSKNNGLDTQFASGALMAVELDAKISHVGFILVLCDTSLKKI